MKIAKRVILSLACIVVPSAADVLLQPYLEVRSIGMILCILLYGPFLILLRLVWKGRFDGKHSPAIPLEEADTTTRPAPSARFSTASLLFAAFFVCACLASYWAGRESTRPNLQVRYESGYQDGQSEASETHVSELLEAREESFQDGYRSAMRDAGIAPYNPNGMPQLSPSSFYDFDGRDALRVDLAKSYGLFPVRTSQETEALFRSISSSSD